MKKIIQFRWFIFAAWIIGAVSILLLSPDLQELVREKGQIGVPDGYSSSEAGRLIEEMSEEEDENTISAVLVFREETGIGEEEKEEIAQGIDILEERQEELGISDILSFQESDQIAEQVISEDETTLLAPFSVSLEGREIEESREAIYAAVESVEVEHRLTGEAYISQDIVRNSEEGLQKTEYITVGFILFILLLVFQSLIAPFIPLVTVGLSYLAAQGIVAFLADTVDFPLSTFTQIFMVAVMFGIGTDYCILLISRFKEELQHHESSKDAVLATYKASGKTVLFAGIAVLIGFSTIGLSTFSLYQSAVAVAVGVAVILIALATLVPFFLVVLGKKLFWPFDKNVSHKESKVWGTVGRFAWARPLLALAIILVVVLPSLLTYDGEKSYNSLEEIGSDYDSVEGFNWIADSVGPGEAMPATVVLQIEEAINSAEQYQDIEYISEQIARMDHVEAVRSATRPAGEIIEDFTIDSQTDQIAGGIGESTDGIDQIETGLSDASSQLTDSLPQLEEAENGVDQLMNGTQQANEGIGEMQNALAEIENGIYSGAEGASEIRSNLETIQSNLTQITSGNEELLAGYRQIEQGLTPLVQGYQAMEQVLGGALGNLNAAEQNNPALAADQQFQTAKGQISAVVNGADGQPGLAGLNQSLETSLLAGLQETNSGFAQSVEGQQQLNNGLGQLISGLRELENGLTQAADGQSQVVSNMPELQAGLTEIYGGQEELKGAFASMQDQMSQLTDGLNESTDGLTQISDGLNEAQDFLQIIPTGTNRNMVSIPEEAIENEDFQQGTEPYLSDDGTITTFEVVLAYSPYSNEAVEMIDDIQATVEDASKNTAFENAEPVISGISSTNNDLQNISDEDYSRTVILMLAGIFLILVILLRSLIMPIYLIGSLVLTYYTSMGIAELIFVNWLGYDGLSWAVPFFAFVILVALGIDYSIFLMGRFTENVGRSVKEELLDAMRNMGTVIISAAIILGGTFAAMLPSGVLSLLQIGTVVLSGLFLYAFIMLPLFIPIMVKLFGTANWWPFKRNKEEKA